MHEAFAPALGIPTMALMQRAVVVAVWASYFALAGCGAAGTGGGGAPATASSITQASSVSEPPSGAAPPSCTYTGAIPDTEVADPGAPHGLFVMGSFSGGSPGTFTSELVSNRDVCGADIFVNWNQVDKGPSASPRYDWSSVDQSVSPWESAGKTVNLIVWGSSEGGTTQHSTPAWVESQVQMITCGGKTAPTPVFWQPGYMSNWEAFISATVAHFNGDPHIGYIRFGIGIGGEGLASPAIRKPDCAAQWDAAGYPGAFSSYTQELIAYEGSLHSSHQLMAALNTFDDVPVGSDTARWAAAAGIGFGFEGLQSIDASEIQRGTHCSADWCALFGEYAGKVPLHVQTLGASDPGPGAGPVTANANSIHTGPLPPLLGAALSLHAQIFELYPEDWELAFDPSYPGYATYHAAYSQAIDAAAAIVGVAKPTG